MRHLAAPRAGYAAQPTHTEAGALAKQLTRAPHAIGPSRRGPDEPRRTVTGPCRRCMTSTCCRGSEPLRTRKGFPTRSATIRLSRPRQAARERGAAEFPAGDVAPTQGDEATPGYTPTRTPQSPVVRPRSLERSELPQIGGIGDGAAIPEAIAGEGPRPSSRADWHCRGPPGPGANANALSSMYVPQLLHSACMQGAAAAAQWEAMSWFQTSREALSYNPTVPVAQLLEAITRGAAAGATAASQEELERLRAAAAPGGHVTIAEAVRSLARADGYLAASLQEALLACFAGEAGAAAIATGATASRAAHVQVGADVPAADDALLAAVAQCDRARGRGRRGRGRGNRGRRGRGGSQAQPQNAEAEEEQVAPSAPPASHNSMQFYLDTLRPLDVAEVLKQRVYTLQSPPRQLKGLLRNAFRVGLETIRDAPSSEEASDGWKLFLLAPRMLLYRSPGEQRVPPEELRRRERAFQGGHWRELLQQAAGAAATAPSAAQRGRRQRTEGEAEADLQRRAAALAHFGELSAAAKALTALPLAPTNQDTLRQLRDPVRRPPEPQIPINPELGLGRLGTIELSSVRLIANVRRSRKGAAPGPSGCTGEHLRVLLDDEHCAELLLGAARKLAIAQVPGAILPALRLGRMVALSKPSGDVRAVVMGDAFRRLVARTLAQQLSTEFQRACAPFQFALSTKAGAEALVRVDSLRQHANIQVHLGKTRTWNSAGEEPPGLLDMLPPEDAANPCWTGSWTLPAEKRGVVVLGSPVGCREFVEAKLQQRLEDQDRLLQRIPLVPHLQCAWLLLLFCGAPRCTYMLRTCPQQTQQPSPRGTMLQSSAAWRGCWRGAKPGRRSQPRVLGAPSSPCAWGGLGWGLRSRNVTPHTLRPGRTRCGRSALTTRARSQT